MRQYLHGVTSASLVAIPREQSFARRHYLPAKMLELVAQDADPVGSASSPDVYLGPLDVEPSAALGDAANEIATPRSPGVARTSTEQSGQLTSAR